MAEERRDGEDEEALEGVGLSQPVVDGLVR